MSEFLIYLCIFLFGGLIGLIFAVDINYWKKFRNKNLSYFSNYFIKVYNELEATYNNLYNFTSNFSIDWNFIQKNKLTWQDEMRMDLEMYCPKPVIQAIINRFENILKNFK